MKRNAGGEVEVPERSLKRIKRKYEWDIRKCWGSDAHKWIIEVDEREREREPRGLKIKCRGKNQKN